MSSAAAESTLRDWRRGLGLTQLQLARLAGVARTTISHLETGRSRPGPGLARRLCRSLGSLLGREFASAELFPGAFKPLSGGYGACIPIKRNVNTHA